MNLRAPAILCSARPHGETAVIARLLTAEHGLVAAYVAGGRGRRLRPVMIAGNLVEAELRSRPGSQMPFARIELIASRASWLGEPLPASAIEWATALTAAALPERHAYPALYQALAALLEAICHAPSARGWAGALVAYEALVLRELGYGGGRPGGDTLAQALCAMDTLAVPLERYLLAGRAGSVMAARARVRDRLARIMEE